MKSFHQFISEIKTISYKMAKPHLGLPKGKAYAKRSSSSAGGAADGDGGDGGGGDGGDGD